MSTARRIQLGILLTIFVVLALGGVGILATVRSELVGSIDEQLEAGAETLEQLGELDASGQADLFDTVASQPDRQSALLAYAATGELEIAVPSGVGDQDDPLPDVGRVGMDGLRERAGSPFQLPAVDGSLDYRVVSAQVGEGVLVIATPLDDVRSTLRRLTAALLGGAALAVAVIGVATTIIIRRAINPIDDMIDAAVAVGHGDLSTRVETASPDPDVVRLSDALNDMLHQLEDAFAEKDASEDKLRQFVADASHELRTPLSSIRGYSELYLTGAATDPEAVERAMTRIHSESVRTGTLVQDLLLLARLDQGREIRRAAVDMTRLLTDSVADAEAIEPERPIVLRLPDRTASIVGDEERLRQVVGNLLANTRAHAPGAPVEVELRVADGEVAVVVRDEGPGLEPEQAAHVFDRFWRADHVRNRETGGSGLGLAIISSIVEAHGGTIDLKTAPGEGATFTVRLPVDGRRDDGAATLREF